MNIEVKRISDNDKLVMVDDEEFLHFSKGMSNTYWDNWTAANLIEDLVHELHKEKALSDALKQIHGYTSF